MRLQLLRKCVAYVTIHACVLLYYPRGLTDGDLEVLICEKAVVTVVILVLPVLGIL